VRLTEVSLSSAKILLMIDELIQFVARMWRINTEVRDQSLIGESDSGPYSKQTTAWICRVILALLFVCWFWNKKSASPGINGWDVGLGAYFLIWIWFEVSGSWRVMGLSLGLIFPGVYVMAKPWVGNGRQG